MSEVKSRLEVLGELFDKSEKGEDLEPIPLVEDPPEKIDGVEDPPEKQEPEETVEQKEARAEKTKVTEEKPEGAPEDDKAKTPEVTDEVAAARAGTAPLSWKPESKAAWAALPEVVRQDITRRELEAQRALTYSDRARKFAHEFAETIKPFDHLIRAQNSTPLAAVKNLMVTAAILNTGDQKLKAKTVSDICINYGIDMEELDSALAVALKNRQSNASRHLTPQQIQMLQPVFEKARRAEELDAQQTEKYQVEAEETVQAMLQDPKYPFFAELQEDIADIMEMSYKRGKKLSMPEAYERAAKIHGKVSKAVEQKADAASVSKAAAVLAKARSRASATRGAPSTPGKATGAPKDRREAIAQAFDAAAEA